MPNITRKGVTLTEALQEAAAIAPVQRAMLYAYELWHVSLSEPVRFVNDLQDLTATLEADAPRDAGQEVTFVSCPLAFRRPAESDDAASPTVQLTRPDVASALAALLEAARGSTEPWHLIERLYASDDTSTPALLPPLSFELTQVVLKGSEAALAAQYDDDANVAVPRITFKREEYPGLQR